jgi:hypothetical protein
VSVYSSVELSDEFDDGPDAAPWVDVAHDNGGYDRPDGCVRLTIGEDFDHASRTFLTRAQAWELAQALARASLMAIPDLAS